MESLSLDRREGRPPAEASHLWKAKLALPLGLTLVWLLVQLGLLLIHAPQAFDGVLTGPDSHMRMVRVAELLQGEGWYDGTISRSNAPYGETLHWSRPYDLLLILLSLPMALVAGQAAGLSWAAGWISPLLHLACAAAVAWAALPVVSRGLTGLAGIRPVLGRVVRPLLGAARADLAAAARAAQLRSAAPVRRS